MKPASLASFALVVSMAMVVGCGSKLTARAKTRVKQQASARVANVPRPPPLPPPPPRNADGTYTVAGLRYVEIVTGGAAPNAELPLVVALHGHGGAGESFVKHFTSLGVKARIVAPFGPEPAEHSGFEWFPRVAHMPQRQIGGVIRPAINRVGAWVAELEKVRATTGKPIVTGFSQGAILTYGLAFLKADMFSVACAMAGELPQDMLDHATLPPVRPEIHGFHGVQDPTIPFARGKQTVNGLKALGFTVDFKAYPGVGHAFEPAQADVLACIENGVRRVRPTPTTTRPPRR
jgi:phospholipase/carboxylesterase